METMKSTHETKPPQELKDESKDAKKTDVMTSSLASAASSLNSPVDSGVQLLDSESDMTSVMSNSCDIIDNLPVSDVEDCSDQSRLRTETENTFEAIRQLCSNLDEKLPETRTKDPSNDVPSTEDATSDVPQPLVPQNEPIVTDTLQFVVAQEPQLEVDKLDFGLRTSNEMDPKNLMTKSDIANQNIHVTEGNYSKSAPSLDFLDSICKSFPDCNDVPKNYESGKNEEIYANEEIVRNGQKGRNERNDTNEENDKNERNNKRDKETHSIKPNVSIYFDSPSEINLLNDETLEIIKNERLRSEFEYVRPTPGTQIMENLDSEADLMTVSLNSVDLMNVSLNSYELLDYTLQNTVTPLPNLESEQMNVSMSEEVNENLRVSLEADLAPVEQIQEVEEVKPIQQEEQIVFRRQRKKKNKSDTPKKRVSFHEDILNSTKIDDIHINHGFVTIEPDVATGFFQRGFIRKPDVVKGRYSWAAEGDAPFYEEAKSQREVKSDIYIHTARLTSTSSSSRTSSSSASNSSSIDEEDDETSEEVKKVPVFGQPKSSCLKKSKQKKIDTKVVEEESIRKKRSESNLLDSNLFGSLKSILFSTSVPLAERGVPEGQEDVAVYSSSHDASFRRRSSGGFVSEEPVTPAKPNALDLAKNNLKLTRSEGFYPNYPNQNVPSNIILCDSTVYEHRGISYSYEYDNFKKTFEQEKPKSSTIYQKILKEFNFFKRKAKEASTPEDKEYEFIEEEKKEVEPAPKPHSSPINKFASNTRMDWSDNDTSSDLTEATGSTRHLNSPKRRVSKPNHYAVQNFKSEPEDRCLPALRPASSKTSLINRFLRNVTLKKMLDLKLQKKQRSSRTRSSLYLKGLQPDWAADHLLNKQLEDEVIRGRESKVEIIFDKSTLRLKRDVFRDNQEKLVRVFPVRSAYTTSGDSNALLLVLTDRTLYICSFALNAYTNHYVLPYTELNTVLIGPNAQTIHLSNYDNDMQCVFTTGSAHLTGELMSQLEVAMRRDKNKPNLPAVKQLNMRDMANLRKAICKQTSIGKDEEYFHYGIVNLQEYNTDVAETPLGPNKEGPLMFRISDSDSRWETAYFILKAGVLYMLSSPTHRVPMRVLPLINGACQGARRLYNCPRPHTFQLTVAGTTLHLAAPDEYVASDWLQSLVQAASGTYNHREKSVAQSCTLLMTSEHIVTVREAFPCTINFVKSSRGHNPIKGTQALSCAAISDLTAFRLPSAEQSWCVLEFACREVHESSGDWILYFATNAELETFISTLEMLWDYHNENGDSFPLSTIPETEPLNKKCVETYNVLQNAWPTLQLDPQSF